MSDGLTQLILKWIIYLIRVAKTPELVHIWHSSIRAVSSVVDPDFGRLDPDPDPRGQQKLPIKKEEKRYKISFFEVLDFLF
jgi:hypothetical protein